MRSVTKKIKVYMAGVLIGSFVGALLYMIPPRWEGIALVSIGQLRPDVPIEEATVVCERLKLPFFVQEVADLAKNKNVLELLDANNGAGLTCQPIKNDVVIIKVTARSPKLTQVSIDSVAAELIDKHNEILNKYTKDIYREIAKIHSEIDALSKEIYTSLDVTTSDNDNKGKINETWLGFAAMMKHQDLDYKLHLLENKNDRHITLLQSVDSTNIRRTSLLEPISISEKRLFSKLWRACLFGALLGILLSMFWAQRKK